MNKEILMVVDAVSNEKGVDKEIIFEALEAALGSATRKRHGEGIDVRVAINRKSGDYDTWRRWKVFADDSNELESPDAELRLDDALEINKDAQVGGYVALGTPSRDAVAENAAYHAAHAPGAFVSPGGFEPAKHGQHLKRLDLIDRPRAYDRISHAE